MLFFVTCFGFFSDFLAKSMNFPYNENPCNYQKHEHDLTFDVVKKDKATT